MIRTGVDSPRKAHPRSRGENLADLFIDAAAQGSSPLTRGKLAARRPRRERPRAHPRSRGENQVMVRMRVFRVGSSPLTRGKRFPAPAVWVMTRLIPAHAGKTRQWPGRSGAPWAHPRSRGENDQGAPDHGWPVGSSPLTRGKPGCTIRRARCIGLIPAHAGKTRTAAPSHRR